MTRVNCVSRAKHAAVRLESESDLDEWLCEVELDGVVTISKVGSEVTIKTRSFKLNFSYGDWIVEDSEGNFRSFSNESFDVEFIVD